MADEDAFRHYLPQRGRLQFYGWLDAGFVGNTSSPNSRFNGPYNAVDRSNEVMFNQGYLVSEVALPCDGSLGLGGRVDLLYGEDVLLGQSRGWEAEARVEWFRDEDGTRVGLNRTSNPNNPPFVGNFWSLSAGVNWTPTTNLIVRPELRWDCFDGTGLPYDDGTEDEQLLLAADVIWRF